VQIYASTAAPLENTSPAKPVALDTAATALVRYSITIENIGLISDLLPPSYYDTFLLES